MQEEHGEQVSALLATCQGTHIAQRSAKAHRLWDLSFLSLNPIPGMHFATSSVLLRAAFPGGLAQATLGNTAHHFSSESLYRHPWHPTCKTPAPSPSELFPSGLITPGQPVPLVILQTVVSPPHPHRPWLPEGRGVCPLFH